LGKFLIAAVAVAVIQQNEITKTKKELKTLAL
jgi:hypothetical protein